MRKKDFVLLIGIAMMAFPVWSQIRLGGKAYLPGVMGQPMRAVGLAGAVDAIAMGTTGLYYNPAGMNMVTQYDISGGYGFIGGANGHSMRVSIVDSKSNAYVAGGFGYSYNYCHDNPYQTRTHTIHGALSGVFGNKRVKGSIGVTFDYKNEYFGGYPNAIKGLTFDVGTIVTISGIFRTAIVGRNLRRLGPGTPRRLELGSGVTYNFVNLDFDLVFDFDSKSSTTTSFAASSEFLFKGFALRAGFNMDRVIGAKMIGAGFGYTSKWVGFDIGYNHDISHPDHWFVGLDLSVYLHRY